MPNSFAKLFFFEPSPLARRLYWHVLSTGTVTLDERDHHNGHDKAGAHLFWLQSGCGTWERTDGAQRLTRGPRVWLVDLSQPRTYAPDKRTQMVTTGFRFAGPALGSWLEVLGETREFVLAAKDFNFICRAQRFLQNKTVRRRREFEWEAHKLISEVLGVLLRAAKHDVAAKPPPPPVARVLNTVLADPTRDWHVRELVQLAGISYSGLRVLFHKTQGESVHDFLRRVRLDQARRVLGDSSLSVKEVAMRLNFSSEFSFSHFFRRKAGVSPSRFRETLRAR
ncbi:MAG: helix-turn-helix transcriptional regulator [Verrucomicrobia bacterium]|nr:helix-turn-helix transcriptional regulator [Verrucomicrobiota bacterium]